VRSDVRALSKSQLARLRHSSQNVSPNHPLRQFERLQLGGNGEEC
jgi:hypothetical protein